MITLTVSAAVIALVAAFLSRDYLLSEDPDQWTDDDVILVVHQDKGTDSPGISISATYNAKAGSGAFSAILPPTQPIPGQHAFFSSGAYRTGDFGSDPVSYTVTYGERATSLIRQCGAIVDEATKVDLGLPPPQEISLLSLPEDFQRQVASIESRAGRSLSASAAFEGNINCELPAERMWGQRGSRYSFSSPTIRVESFTSYSGLDSGRMPLDSSLKCATVSVAAGPYTTFDSASPASEDTAISIDGSPQPVGQTWRSCPDPLSVQASLNDLERADLISRSIFVSGALLGIVGALLVEIMLALLDRRPVGIAPSPHAAAAKSTARTGQVRFNQR